MAPSLKSDCCSVLGLFLNSMKFKGKTGSISQTPASPFCHDGAGGCSPALGLRGVAPGHRSGPRRLPLDPFHSPRLPRHRHPQPGGSGHLWVYAADRATLVSEPEWPRLHLPPGAPSPSLSPAGLCAGSSPTWSPHSIHPPPPHTPDQLLPETSSSLGARERPQRPRWEATGPRTELLGLAPGWTSGYLAPPATQSHTLCPSRQMNRRWAGPLPRSPWVRLSA